MVLRLLEHAVILSPVVSIEKNSSRVKTILVDSIGRNIDNLLCVMYNTETVCKIYKKEAKHGAKESTHYRYEWIDRRHRPRAFWRKRMP